MERIIRIKQQQRSSWQRENIKIGKKKLHKLNFQNESTALRCRDILLVFSCNDFRREHLSNSSTSQIIQKEIKKISSLKEKTE